MGLLNKKNLLMIFAIAAFGFYTAGQFFPFTSIHYADVLKKQHITNNPTDWWSDNYNLVHHYRQTEFSVEKTYTNDVFYIFYFLPIVISNEQGGKVRYFGTLYTESTTIFSKSVDTIFTIFLIMLTFFSEFFGFLCLKYINKKKNRYSLYASIIIMISLILFIYGNLYFYSSLNPDSPEFVKLGYGFYYQLIATILYFIIFFIQYKEDIVRKIRGEPKLQSEEIDDTNVNSS